MIAGFEKISLRESGCLWCGFIRPQTTGITAVCRNLDSPEARLFHDSAKIKAGSVDDFFVKRYNLPGILVQIRRFFKPARPLVVLRGAAHLESLSIPTPRVLGALTAWRGVCRREYLVTAMLGANDQLGNDLLLQTSAAEVWQVILQKIIPMLVKLHDSGALHGDLNLRNIYIDSSGSAGLIDLDGMKIGSKSLSAAERAGEIGRLISGYMIYTGQRQDFSGYVAQALEVYGSLTAALPDEEETRSVTEKFIRRAEKYL